MSPAFVFKRTLNYGGIMDELQLSALQGALGYCFKDMALLVEALTHSSFANEAKNKGSKNNERLEFLGDSILGMTVAALIYKNCPKLSEGAMTRLRADLVCEKSLAKLAVDFGLGECLQLGRGEENGGGRKRPSILADAVEAVLAAMYLDGGLEPVSKLIAERLPPKPRAAKIGRSDFKSVLQEIIQLKPEQTISYTTTDESGPDHMKVFTVEVRLNGSCVGVGVGKSKKEAEQLAAKAALGKIHNS